MSFASMKKNRKKAIDNLVKAADEGQGEKKGYGDDRYWKLTRDKSGNGYAIIRFLPAPEGEDLPWVKRFKHAFNNNGQWYIDDCRTSFNDECPVCKLNTQLWNSGYDGDKEIVKKRKRQLKYVSNILVVSDPANPQNEGKVFLFEYGKQIHDKIMDVMQPEFPDDDPMNPFDFWEGSNFKLKIRTANGYPTYDKSDFDKQSELLDGDDDELEVLYNKLYSLADLNDPKNFKSFAEQEKRLNTVLGESVAHNTAESVALDEEEEAPRIKEAPARSTPVAAVDDDDDDDDAMSYFKSLASE